MKKKPTADPLQHEFRSKTVCGICNQPQDAHYVEEHQSKNGVRVIVRRFHGGTTVDASCMCLGMKGRAHSNSHCPNLNP